MNALITGISGFVGSHLAEYLLENTNWEIYGILRWRSPLDNIEGILRNPRVHFLYADLRDGVSIQKAVHDAAPDYVFHLAAQSFPKTSFDAPLDTLETNVQGTVRLLDAIKSHPGKRVRESWIHVCSSSEVYGRAKQTPITENAPFHPASPYAVSKVGADLMAQHYAEAYGMNIVVTRMFTHTGPRRGDVFMESTFAKQIAMIEARQIDPIVKHGNLESLRTIADVRDAVRAYVMALTVNPQRGAVYNIGGDHTCTVKDVLHTLFKLSEHKVRMFFEPDPERMRPVDADNQVPDCEKFRKHTGWEPQIPFKKTMSDLLDYWRERVKKHAHLTR